MNSVVLTSRDLSIYIYFFTLHGYAQFCRLIYLKDYFYCLLVRR